ncbi:outer membrane protein transport protein [bacterium]|nr:outer membrane protein transport protein [bacterium]
MNKMRTRAVLLSILLIPALLLGNGLNLNGVGSKSIGMGGAFVGLADDFSAVFFNPAGLSQLKGTNFSFYFTDVIPTATYKLDMAGIDATSKTNHYISGALAAFFDVSEKIKLGFYADIPSGLGAEWDGKDLANLGGNFLWMSKIGIFNFGPAISFKASEKFAIGATVNIAYGIMEMQRPVDADGNGTMDAQYVDDGHGTGLGFTIGMLFKPSPKFQIGLTVKTENKVGFSGTANAPLMQQMGAPADSDFDRDITWPIWVGGGIAFMPNDKLTFTADVQWTQWSKIDHIMTKYADATWAFAMGQMGGDKMPFHWEDALQIRFGAQYKLNETIALRAGYYNDPTPGVDETANILLPQLSYNVITVGMGFNAGGPFSFDFSLEYLMGKDLEIPVGTYAHAMPGIHGMTMIVPNIAVHYNLSK